MQPPFFDPFDIPLYLPPGPELTLPFHLNCSNPLLTAEPSFLDLLDTSSHPDPSYPPFSSPDNPFDADIVLALSILDPPFQQYRHRSAVYDFYNKPDPSTPADVYSFFMSDKLSSLGTLPVHPPPYACSPPSDQDSSPGDQPFLSSSPPTSLPFQSFASLGSVLVLLQDISTCTSFTPGYLRRFACRHLQSQLASPSSLISTSLPKPHAGSINEMFHPLMFCAGASELPASEQRINADLASQLHVRYCNLCSSVGRVDCDCYFFQMVKCLRNGWVPYMPIPAPPIPLYRAKPVTKADRFFKTKQSIIQKMVNAGFIRGVPPDPNDSTPYVDTPFNIVFKKSDIHRISLYTDIRVKCDKSLETINGLLASMGQPPLKPRPVFDVTGSGVNNLLFKIPFSNVTFNDLIARVAEDDYIAITDVSSYFNMFPLAAEVRHLFSFVIDGVRYIPLTILFGISPAPAHCITWTAEFTFYMICEGLSAVCMTDDWAVVRSCKFAALEDIAFIKRMLGSLGFSFADEKDRHGRSISFLGVNIDTESLAVSFSVEKASCARNLLTTMVSRLSDQSVKKSRLLGELRSIAGMLNHFAEVMQSARLRIRSTFKYISEISLPAFASTPDPHISPDHSYLPDLVSDLRWWIDTLASWSSGGLCGTEFPILNSRTILANPDSIYVVMSDASGPDGLGFIHGPLYELNPSYFSKRWPKGFNMFSTMEIELLALHDFLVLLLSSGLNCVGSYTVSINGISFLIWISDSASAIWCINKGYTTSTSCFNVLSKIYAMLDVAKICVVGFWVDRANNTISDFTSHLATLIDREFIDGKIGDWSFQQYFRRHGQEGSFSFSFEDSGSLPPVLRSLEDGSLSCLSPIHDSVSSDLHEFQQRLGEVSPNSSVLSQNLLCIEENPLAGRRRLEDAFGLDQRSSVRGSNSISQEGSFDSQSSPPSVQTASLKFQRYSDGHDALVRSRRTSSPGRDSPPSSGIGHSLESLQNFVHSSPLPSQNPPSRRPSSGSLSDEGRSLCSGEHETSL